MITDKGGKGIIGSFWPDADFREWGWKYSFTANLPIPKDAWPKIIEAIEKVLKEHQNPKP